MSSQHPSPAAVAQARQWLLDCALSSGEVEPEDAQNRILWTLSDQDVVSQVDRQWDGGWSHFVLTVDDPAPMLSHDQCIALSERLRDVAIGDPGAVTSVAAAVRADGALVVVFTRDGSAGPVVEVLR